MARFSLCFAKILLFMPENLIVKFKDVALIFKTKQ